MITNISQRARLMQMQSRAKHIGLFGVNQDGSPWRDHLDAALSLQLNGAEDVDQNESRLEFAKLYRRSFDGDIDARQQLNALRVETVQNYVISSMNFGSFFEVRTLKDNDSPAVQNETKQEIKARYVGQDGGVEETPVIKPQTEALVALKELISDEVTWRTKDIYTGNVEAAAKATFEVAFDLRNQLEGILKTLYLTSIGAFGLTGAKNDRVYNANSRIASGVLPTTNALQITGITGSTKFGPLVFEEAVDYAVRFKDADPQGDLMPTGELIVPSQDIREVASGITFTGAKPTEFAERVMRDGFYELGLFFGINWTVIPDNTLARKKCYPKLNRPVGLLWFKPGMDDEEETVNKKMNLATRWEKKCFGAAIPTPWKKNSIAVEYRT